MKTGRPIYGNVCGYNDTDWPELVEEDSSDFVLNPKIEYHYDGYITLYVGRDKIHFSMDVAKDLKADIEAAMMKDMQRRMEKKGKDSKLN